MKFSKNLPWVAVFFLLLYSRSIVIIGEKLLTELLDRSLGVFQGGIILTCLLSLFFMAMAVNELMKGILKKNDRQDACISRRACPVKRMAKSFSKDIKFWVQQEKWSKSFLECQKKEAHLKETQVRVKTELSRLRALQAEVSEVSPELAWRVQHIINGVEGLASHASRELALIDLQKRQINQLINLGRLTQRVEEEEAMMGGQPDMETDWPSMGTDGANAGDGEWLYDMEWDLASPQESDAFYDPIDLV